MKANYFKSKAEYEKAMDRIAKKVLDDNKEEIYDKVTKDVFYQAMSIFYYALYLEGWSIEELSELHGSIDSCCDILQNGVMGKELTTRDLIPWFKEKGLDVYGTHYKWSAEEEE